MVLFQIRTPIILMEITLLDGEPDWFLINILSEITTVVDVLLLAREETQSKEKKGITLNIVKWYRT